ncbi:MAG: hypothetical protein HYX41_04160 [Bdellovibrio sp.]|nr:hypothetical protein [Bdellovibrio sp.]
MNPTTLTGLLDQLVNLEADSKTLDPAPDVSTAWLSALASETTQFLTELPQAPAWVNPESESKGNLEYRSLFESPPAFFPKILSQVMGELQASGIDTAGGRYFGYIPGGGILPAAFGDFLASLTNRYAGLYLASPAAVECENRVIQSFLDLFQFTRDAWGTLTSGGSIATLSAILTARETRPREEWDRSPVYVSTLVHSAVLRAIKAAGLDPRLVRTIPVDSATQKMALGQLVQAMEDDLRSGRKPWIVVGSLGTTGAGSVDSVSELLGLKEKYKFWLHLDGAYGGFFALTQSGRQLFQGCEMADSIVLDPHKSLFMPYGIGAVLVRNGALLKRAFSVSDRILADLEDPHPSPADYSPELTRPYRAIRVELALRAFGGKAFQAALEEKLLLARYAYFRLSEMAEIELLNEPELSVVPFRIKNADDEKTKALLVRILARQSVHMSSIQLNGKFFIRLCVLSFRSHLAEVNLALDEIRQAMAEV